MSKTNTGLVQHAEKALQEKWYYGWGAFGEKATSALVKNLVSRYPEDNKRWEAYMNKAVAAGTRLCDCYGLVKSYLWWTNDSGNPVYNSAQDRNTTMAFSVAQEKGPLFTMPEIPGIILWMNGHVGVYCGSGRFIELRGGGVGAYDGLIQNGRIVRGSSFTHWFKDVNIDYSEEQLTEQEEPEMKRYETLDEISSQFSWAAETIKKLMDRGYLKELNLTEDMIRMFVVNDQAGVYDLGE